MLVFFRASWFTHTSIYMARSVTALWVWLYWRGQGAPAGRQGPQWDLETGISDTSMGETLSPDWALAMCSTPRWLCTQPPQLHTISTVMSFQPWWVIALFCRFIMTNSPLLSQRLFNVTLQCNVNLMLEATDLTKCSIIWFRQWLIN